MSILLLECKNHLFFPYQNAKPFEFTTSRVTTGVRRTQQILPDVTAELALGGTGLEQLQGPECQLYVHPHGGVTPMRPAGSMVLIPRWLTVRSARRCAFTGKMTAVVFQQASK